MPVFGTSQKAENWIRKTLMIKHAPLLVLEPKQSNSRRRGQTLWAIKESVHESQRPSESEKFNFHRFYNVSYLRGLKLFKSARKSSRAHEKCQKRKRVRSQSLLFDPAHSVGYACRNIPYLERGNT